MTDGQMGEVVQEWFPGAEHRRCAWHLFNNFRSKHSGVMLAKYFWKASRVYTEAEFRSAMKTISVLKLSAYVWLLKLEQKLWSQHTFGKCTKSDHITNNHTESFNGWLGDLREKNIVKLNDGIRQKVMVTTHLRNVLSEKWEGQLCANITKKLKQIVLEGRRCSTAVASQSEYEVLDQYTIKFVVTLDKKTCTCGSWELSSVACKHSVTCITHARLKVEDFVDICYYKDTFKRANGEFIIHPIADPTFWGPGTGTAPQSPESRGGRPQNVRRRDHNLEPAATSNEHRHAGLVQCAKCKGLGHNSRTCGRVRARKMTVEERQVHEASKASGSSQTLSKKRLKKNDEVSQSQPPPEVEEARGMKHVEPGDLHSPREI